LKTLVFKNQPFDVGGRTDEWTDVPTVITKLVVNFKKWAKRLIQFAMSYI